MADQKGKYDLVKWDRIILVAIRPNIKDNMRPNSIIFSFFNICDCGDASHETEQNVKIKSGDNLSKACGKDKIRESCFERGWDLLSRMAIYVL